MLIRYVIGLVSLTVSCVALIISLPEIEHLYAKMDMLQEQIKGLEDYGDELHSALGGEGNYLSNISIAEMMETLDGASVSEITAYALDDQGFSYELLTTDSINDVNFFTEQVTQMSFSFYVSERQLFMEQVEEKVARIDKMEVSTDHAMILIPTVSGYFE